MTFRFSELLGQPLPYAEAETGRQLESLLVGYLGVEAVVKNKAHFVNEPGNWGFFRFTDEEAAKEGRSAPPRKLANAAPTNACSSCHQPGAAQDSIFTQYYPVLRAAKAAYGVPEDK